MRSTCRPRWVRFDRCHRPALRAQPDLTHTEVIGGNTKQSLYLASRYQTLGKMTLGPLRSPNTPRSVCRLYELDMRLNEPIKVHCTLCRPRATAAPSGANRHKHHPANRSHSPLAIGKRSGRLVLTRPAARSIYSASLQTSDEPNDTAALRPGHMVQSGIKRAAKGSLSARRRPTCQPTLKGDRCWSLVF